MLPEAFYARPAEVVAPALLGQTLVVTVGSVQAQQDTNSERSARTHQRDKRQLPAGRYRVRIVETEAYVGTHDLACHASKGRTPRTEVMFGAAGLVYVYLIYGMYHMLNIVTGQVGEGQAVLIRAVEPLEPPTLPVNTNGPGKLCRALDIDKRHNGRSLHRSLHKSLRGSLQSEALHLCAGTPPRRVITTPRIGIDYAGDWKDAPLRFFDADSAHVSKRRKQ